MKLDRIEVRRLRLPLLHPFETSFGRTTAKEFLLVAASADGVTGYGECVADTDPFYLPETNETVLHVLRDFLVPDGARASTSPTRATSGPRWPACAATRWPRRRWRWRCGSCRRAGRARPLHALLGGRGGTIEAGVSIGLQADDQSAGGPRRARRPPRATAASRSRSSPAATWPRRPRCGAAFPTSR